MNGSLDFAPSFFEFQCADGEYVSGADFVSSLGIVSNVDLVSCAASPTRLTNVCQVRTFDAHDDRANGGIGDWDGRSYKGECGFDQYVAGISEDTVTHAPHSILCCNVDAMATRQSKNHMKAKTEAMRAHRQPKERGVPPPRSGARRRPRFDADRGGADNGGRYWAFSTPYGAERRHRRTERNPGGAPPSGAGAFRRATGFGAGAAEGA